MKKYLFFLLILNCLSLNFFCEEILPEIPETVLVQSGSFTMGNLKVRMASDTVAFPCRTVNITYDYYIGKYEVTYEQFDAFCSEISKEKPRGEKRGKYPVMYVTWTGIVEYCNWLSEKEGLHKAYDDSGRLIDSDGNETDEIELVEGYRLPTEAEWEYAARGGVHRNDDYTYAGGKDVNEYVWYLSNSFNKDNDLFEGKGPHEVGGKKPNQLGIYDMNGNLWERCQDWYEEDITDIGSDNPLDLKVNKYDERVLRGGSWASCIDGVKLAKRCKYSINRGTDLIGFRIVRKK